MSNVPEGAQLSEDGNYYWDGQAWQPVEGGAAAAGGASGAAEGSAEGSDVSAADLEPIGDLGVEPGDESKMTDKTKPYFAREGEPTEEGSDVDAAIDESTYTGPASTGGDNDNG